MSWYKYCLVALLGLLAGLYQATTLTFFSGWWSGLQIVLPLTVFFIVLERRGWALAFAAGAGLSLDLFPLTVSTLAFWRYLAIVALLIVLGQTILTNRSLYAGMVLFALGQVLDWLWLWVVGWVYATWHVAYGVAPQWRQMLYSGAAGFLLTVFLCFLGFTFMRRYSAPQRQVTLYG